jgi:hypothetical protein
MRLIFFGKLMQIMFGDTITVVLRSVTLVTISIAVTTYYSIAFKSSALPPCLGSTTFSSLLNVKSVDGYNKHWKEILGPLRSLARMQVTAAKLPPELRTPKSISKGGICRLSLQPLTCHHKRRFLCYQCCTFLHYRAHG